MMHKEDASGLLHELVLADFILCLFAPRGCLLVRGTSVSLTNKALLSLLPLPSLARHLLAIKFAKFLLWFSSRDALHPAFLLAKMTAVKQEEADTTSDISGSQITHAEPLCRKHNKPFEYIHRPRKAGSIQKFKGKKIQLKPGKYILRDCERSSAAPPETFATNDKRMTGLPLSQPLYQGCLTKEPPLAGELLPSGTHEQRASICFRLQMHF
ncbi:uncharacterized protein [Triticum aestivum]|uniref:uncharacterized protein n=1 Tax=Triticum aestivum TaxID=4565 RepID=UPI001D0032FB|nr:uncharacterized protein LOC123093850 [Triticum aestivum]